MISRNPETRFFFYFVMFAVVKIRIRLFFLILRDSFTIFFLRSSRENKIVYAFLLLFNFNSTCFIGKDEKLLWEIKPYIDGLLNTLT